jgi:hypothetical protein
MNCENCSWGTKVIIDVLREYPNLVKDLKQNIDAALAVGNRDLTFFREREIREQEIGTFLYNLLEGYDETVEVDEEINPLEELTRAVIRTGVRCCDVRKICSVFPELDVFNY